MIFVTVAAFLLAQLSLSAFAGVIPLAISSGNQASHTCSVFPGGAAKCWGYNYAGQLGLQTYANRGNGKLQMGNDLPNISLGNGQNASSMATGFFHTCAILTGGGLKCWG